MAIILRYFWERKSMEARLKLEQKEKLHQEEIAQMKMRFFINISHELRTPLTLILAPIQDMLAKTTDKWMKEQLNYVNRNANRLLNLVNQLMDYRRAELGVFKLKVEHTCIYKTVKENFMFYEKLARTKNLEYTLISDIEDNECYADPKYVELILNNFLSNAFKYTPQNGKITFACAATDTDLVFSVKDTGKGISSEDIKNIFTRFYQVDKVNPQGSGIGLALVKAFVELHGGIITAESELGKGSTFTVTLPIHHVENSDNIKTADTEKIETPLITESDVDAELDTIEQENAAIRPDVPLLLVIDDNEDIRRMIAVLMGDDYNVISASNGKEGLSLAAKYVPDVIICDVMMPVMDGLECCRYLKEEVSTSHIPVLMLTACSLDEQRAQGYDSGAHGYLSKPFNSIVLKSRCRNLIENRKRIRNAEIDKPVIAQSDANSSVLDMENKFYARFLEIVNAEMGNPELNVDQLAAKMGLGRSQFYRKIKALTNYSPVELLRNLRLKKSRELLLTTDKSISEIACEVGFSAPAYFTRCYREAFGETPTDRRSKVQ